MVVMFNNKKYAAMQNMHTRLYPEGTAIATDTYFGTFINGPDYLKIIEAFGGYGERVENPDELVAALKRGYEANKSGKTVLLDVAIAK